MDESEQMFIFVNEFINQISKLDKGLREMKSYYVFSEGDVAERFRQDAKSWSEIQNLYRRVRWKQP